MTKEMPIRFRLAIVIFACVLLSIQVLIESRFYLNKGWLLVDQICTLGPVVHAYCFVPWWVTGIVSLVNALAVLFSVIRLTTVGHKWLYLVFPTIIFLSSLLVVIATPDIHREITTVQLEEGNVKWIF